jgi:hypothetical protein
VSAFEWDEAKAALNLQKHGVSFSEAVTVFEDPCALTFFDDEHSHEEERWITVGHSADMRVLLVITTDRTAGTRIISARKANSHERQFYEQHNRRHEN